MINKKFWLMAVLVSICVTISACGGGGSDSPGTGTNPGTGTPPGGNSGGNGTPGGNETPDGTGTPVQNPSGAWLRFTPSKITESVKERSFALPIKVVAKSSKTIAENSTISIKDKGGVFDANQTSIREITQTSYEARLVINTELKPGIHRGSLTVKICLDEAAICAQPYAGSPWDIPYEIEITPWAEARTVHKLLASEAGLALTSMGKKARLAADILVSDNLGKATTWQAQSDQPWLKVTSTGVTGEAIHVQADPSALADNTLNYAKISISATDGFTSAPKPVVVGLWKGSNDISVMASNSSSSDIYVNLIADPIRPYVYTHHRGGIIEIFNIYTGSKVGSLSAAGAMFKNMMVSPDGAFLYAVDGTSHTINVFDLKSGQLVNAWPLKKALSDYEYETLDLIYARPNGEGLVVLNNGQIFRAADGKVMTNILAVPPEELWLSDDVLPASHIAVSPDGMRIFSTGNRGRSPQMPSFMDIDYNDTKDGKLSFTRPTTPFPLSNGQDIRLPSSRGVVVSRDGKRVLFLSDDISIWNSVDLTRSGMLTPMLNLTAPLSMTVDGNIIAAESTTQEYYVFSPEGKTLGKFAASIQLTVDGYIGHVQGWNREVVPSSDGLSVTQSGYRFMSSGINSYSDYLLTFSPLLNY